MPNTDDVNNIEDLRQHLIELNKVNTQNTASLSERLVSIDQANNEIERYRIATETQPPSGEFEDYKMSEISEVTEAIDKLKEALKSNDKATIDDAIKVLEKAKKNSKAK